MAAGVDHYGKTGNPKIDGVLSGLAWDTLTLNYSFPDRRSDYEPHYQDPAVRHVLHMNAGHRHGIERALNQIQSFTQLEFTNVTNTATKPDLRFALSRDADPAFAYYPAGPGFAPGGDAFFHGGPDFKNLRPGSYGFSTFVHEIGHTLGLKHGHQAEAGFPRLPHKFDSLEFSVMTYRAFIGGPIVGAFDNEKFGFPQTFMMLDIAALQNLYGANYDFNNTDTTYKWNPNTGRQVINDVGQSVPGGGNIFLTVWDGGGEDTYDLSNYHTNLLIRLAPGSWSVTKHSQLAVLGERGHHLAHGNIYNALLHEGDQRSLIENAIGGSGSDRIFGNRADNELTGNGGADSLRGGKGSDTLIGGLGRDVMSGGDGADTFVFAELSHSVVGRKRDVIFDFHSGDGDKIDLSGIAEATATSLHFIDANPFDGTPGAIRHAGGILQLDIDGNLTADFAIKVAAPLTGTDFILS